MRQGTCSPRASGSRLFPTIAAGGSRPAASRIVGATSRFATTSFTVRPPGKSSGHCMTIGTRIDSSYAVRLSIRPCSPKAKPLSPM